MTQKESLPIVAACSIHTRRLTLFDSSWRGQKIKATRGRFRCCLSKIHQNVWIFPLFSVVLCGRTVSHTTTPPFSFHRHDTIDIVRWNCFFISQMGKLPIGPVSLETRKGE